MYLHLNIFSKEQLMHICTCTELKQDPQVGLFCTFPTFHTVALICRIFKIIFGFTQCKRSVIISSVVV